MATIQKSSDWEKRPAVIKGNYGEEIVRKHIENNDFICYQAVTEKSHAFDFLVVKNHEKAFVVEVKTKALMNRAPETGFNYSNFEVYKWFTKTYQMPVFLLFVDENMGKVYGNWLCNLERPFKTTVNGTTKYYPYNFDTYYGKTIRLYHYESMVDLWDLSEEEIETLKSMSNRSYQYQEMEAS